MILHTTLRNYQQINIEEIDTKNMPLSTLQINTKRIRESVSRTENKTKPIMTHTPATRKDSGPSVSIPPIRTHSDSWPAEMRSDPDSPTCSSSHPSGLSRAIMESFSELKLDDSDDMDLGFDFSESSGDGDVNDYMALPLHIEDGNELREEALIEREHSWCTINSESSTESFTRVTGRKMVHFPPCLVTSVHIVPRATDEEWYQCYFSGHELHRMHDNGTGRERVERRNCVITAEEEDLDL
mmetsp:Transcript_5636/g.8354  ORF Transcript_5636/g.8354 Transcript_5636/m.8354 type:complete len:241 (+) Transcript_5636:105-827(+)